MTVYNRVCLALVLLALASLAQSALLATPSRAATVTVPGTQTINPLDITVVTTGGVAVTAIAAGHRTAGGWIQNPVGATPLCINEVGTAVGTTSAGSTTCVAAGDIYQVTPSSGSVSVVSSDSAHPFSGYGLQN